MASSMAQCELRNDQSTKLKLTFLRRTEHAKQAQKRQADLSVPALLKSNAALAEPVQIPGMRYQEIKITGGPFERFLLSQMSWLCFL